MLGDEGFGPLQDGMPLSSRIADLFLASIAQAHHRVAFLPMSTIEMFESFGNCTIWDFQLKEAHFVIGKKYVFLENIILSFLLINLLKYKDMRINVVF
jgi:hypothetical protein